MSIAEVARRLKNLSPRNDEEYRIFTFALGAIYAAANAEALDFSHTTEPEPGELVRQAQSVLNSLATGDMPRGNRWTAGYYFNDALFRTDVAFERLVRYMRRDYAGELGAQEVLSSDIRAAWDPIHEEVIGMKHYPHRGRRTQSDELMTGLDAFIRGFERCLRDPERTAEPRVRRPGHL